MTDETKNNYPDAWKLLTETDSIDIDNIHDPQHEQIRHLLEDIQGNILKSHGRTFSIFLFLQFDTQNPGNTKNPEKIKEISEWIANLAWQGQIVSALEQENQTKRFLQSNLSSEMVMNFSLSFKGYRTLGFSAEYFFEKIFLDDPFETGMKDLQMGKVKKLNQLGDDLEKEWEKDYKDEDLHAMLLLAHSDHEQLWEKARTIIEEIRSKHIKIVKMEAGCKRKNNREQTVEPFGFPDGISQPLFFTKDINKLSRKNWDPTAKLSLALNVDPFGKKFVGDKIKDDKHYSFGSFLVYRKLEQDVEGFNQKVREIACKLEIKDLEDTRSSEERENLVRAFVVGRRRKDGYPVYSHDPNESLSIDNNSNEINDFNYGVDQEFSDHSALRCPFNAHIRRMNPRGVKGNTEGSGFVYSGTYVNHPDAPYPGGQRNTRIVRRSVPYGLKAELKDSSYLSETTKENLEKYRSLIKKLNDLERDFKIAPIEEMKEGVLFCCFQNSIKNQFYTLQLRYANDPQLGPSKEGHFGVDSLIGRENEETTIEQGDWPKRWNDESEKIKFKDLEESKFSNYVTPRGGEYFFTPSISFLKSLKAE